MPIITPQLQANYMIKYGGYFDALPELDTLANKLPFTQKGKVGLKYQVSFLAGLELGQTASRAGGLYDLNPAIGTELVTAELDGSSITMRAQYAWDDVYASLNGGETSYNDIMSLKMKALGKGASMMRDLALNYGPGAGTALASNIGIVDTTAAAVNTSPSVILTAKSWMRGLWPSMRNALVDIYQPGGTTLRAGNVKVIGTPDQRKTQVTFGISTVTGQATVNPTAVITAGDIIVPAGWRLQSCIGLEAIMTTQTGTLFGVDITTIPQFKTPLFDAANGPVTLQLVREWCSLIADNGCTEGGDLMLSTSAMAALANEYSSKNRDTTHGGVKKQGETGLVFDTPAGQVSVQPWGLAKQGQAQFLAKSCRAYRVGTTDNTMRPIKGLNEGFLTALTEKNGCQSMIFSNQAPFVEQSWHNFIVQNIVSPGDAKAVP